jgi:hypothetical protein
MQDNYARTTDDELLHGGVVKTIKIKDNVFSRSITALVLTAFVYSVLRPETFGLTPNPTDPFFYTGFQTNFDDILNALGQAHYFTTRWSSYLPGLLFNQIFGPVYGRLILRWILTSAILLVVWQSKRFWSFGQRVASGIAILTLPMYARAFMTDYVEYMVVFLGFLMVALAIRDGDHQLHHSAAGGVLLGLGFTANPFALTMMAGPVLLMLFRRPIRPRKAVSHFLILVFSGFAVCIVGMLFFRWRYDLPNVYQPTVRFLSQSSGRDPLQSPRLTWMRYFIWIYAVPLVLITAAVLHFSRRVRFRRVDSLVFVLCLIQYLWQWVDQFVRNAASLEIPYYWSYILPTFGFALAFLVGSLLENKGIFSTFLITFVLIGAIRWKVFDPGFLSSSPTALVVLACAWVLAMWGLLHVSRPITATVLVSGVLITQVGAPIYDPSAYHPYNMSPQYAQVFNQPNSLAAKVYDAALWFEEELDRIPDDHLTHFIIAGGFSSIIVGVYAPQVTGRGIRLEEDLTMSPETASYVRQSQLPSITIYGLPDTVEQIRNKFERAIGDLYPQPSVDDLDPLGHRLLVYELRGPKST